MTQTPTPPGISQRDHAAMDRLVRVLRLHHRIIERRIDSLGIHHSQHRMLMRLSCIGSTASQKDIAAALDVSPSCVARTLKSLSAAGLIEKREGEDSRRNEISIMPKGRQLIDDSIRIVQQIDHGTFDGLSDEEVLRLTRTLERIHENLCRMEAADAAAKGGKEE